MSNVAQRTQHVDGLEHIVQIVSRLSHAHEHHLFDRAMKPRKGHLRHNFSAAHLSDQALFARHAKDTANGATDLGRDAHTIARQAHCFNGLPIVQGKKPTHRSIFCGMA